MLAIFQLDESLQAFRSKIAWSVPLFAVLELSGCVLHTISLSRQIKVSAEVYPR